jgi:hypothetical protein
MITNNHKGGAAWAIMPDGGIALKDGRSLSSAGLRRFLTEVKNIKGYEVLRTKGEPTTMRTLMTQHGHAICDASQKFDIPEHWIAGMIAIEAVRVKGTTEMDVFSLRDEDGLNFSRYQDRPRRVSAGLMQTLLSTARMMAASVDLRPYFAGKPEQLDAGHLCVPAISVLLGTAYMSHQVKRYGSDPVLLVGSYNAGAVYSDTKNPWNIRTYGQDRIPKFVAYANDWLTL